jgi:hypothetical protein
MALPVRLTAHRTSSHPILGSVYAILASGPLASEPLMKVAERMGLAPLRSGLTPDAYRHRLFA